MNRIRKKIWISHLAIRCFCLFRVVTYLLQLSGIYFSHLLNARLLYSHLVDIDFTQTQFRRLNDVFHAITGE